MEFFPLLAISDSIFLISAFPFSVNTLSICFPILLGMSLQTILVTSNVSVLIATSHNLSLYAVLNSRILLFLSLVTSTISICELKRSSVTCNAISVGDNYGLDNSAFD